MEVWCSLAERRIKDDDRRDPQCTWGSSTTHGCMMTIPCTPPCSTWTALKLEGMHSSSLHIAVAALVLLPSLSGRLCTIHIATVPAMR